MRYALTLTQNLMDFNTTDTIIVEAEEGFGEDDKILTAVIAYHIGLPITAKEIVENRLYYIRNCDDIDICLSDEVADENGKEMSWEEYANKDIFKGDK